MRMRATATLVGLGLIVLTWPDTHAGGPEPALPPLPPVPGPESPGLPPLAERSPRNASYTIEARLDPEARTLEGSLVLEWRNTSEQELSTFPFHLYWNAFRNTLSSTARGTSRRWSAEESQQDRSFGWTEVRSIRRLGDVEEDLTPSVRYLHPDGNTDDRTVVEVRSETPVAPGETVRFAIEWDSLRTGLRREGMFTAVFSFVEKFSGAIGPTIVGVALSWAGFSATSEVTPESYATLRHATLIGVAYFPAACATLSVVVLAFYRLNESRLAAARRAVEEGQDPDYLT